MGKSLKISFFYKFEFVFYRSWSQHYKIIKVLKIIRSTFFRRRVTLTPIQVTFQSQAK
jgi:hypothetical protein